MCVCMCMYVYGYVYMNAGAHRSQKRTSDIQGAGITGSCESHNIGTGNTYVDPLQEHYTLNLWATFLIPTLFI